MDRTTDKVKIRRSNERGHANHGWLDTYFSFSFADYYDPKHMGFRSLRVINDDTIAPGRGFGMHEHNDMEIISYILEGELQHKDSMGNGSIIKEGNVQRITAGTGISHSEFNPSSKNRAKLLQIWILPEKKGLTPSYQELNAVDFKKKKGLALIASNEEKKDVVKINQDAQLYRGYFSKGEELDFALRPGRGVWVHMIKGEIELNGTKLSAGDGASIENEKNIHIKAQAEVEFLLFDLR